MSSAVHTGVFSVNRSSTDNIFARLFLPVPGNSLGRLPAAMPQRYTELPLFDNYVRLPPPLGGGSVMRWLWAALALLVALPGHAQYPNKVVRLVIPFAPGDGPDLSARVLVDRLSAVLGQQAIAENRPGAAGSTPAEY